jgi:CBS domain-containing protein
VKKLLSNQQAKVFAVIDQEHRPLGLFSREQAEIFIVHSQIPELTEPLCVQPNQTMEEIEPLLEKAPYSTLLLVNREGKLLGIMSKGEARLSQENEDQLANS